MLYVQSLFSQREPLCPLTPSNKDNIAFSLGDIENTGNDMIIRHHVSQFIPDKAAACAWRGSGTLSWSTKTEGGRPLGMSMKA